MEILQNGFICKFYVYAIYYVIINSQQDFNVFKDEEMEFFNCKIEAKSRSLLLLLFACGDNLDYFR